MFEMVDETTNDRLWFAKPNEQVGAMFSEGALQILDCFDEESSITYVISHPVPFKDQVVR
jgi:hypothetical protein